MKENKNVFPVTRSSGCVSTLCSGEDNSALHEARDLSHESFTLKYIVEATDDGRWSSCIQSKTYTK